LWVSGCIITRKRRFASKLVVFLPQGRGGVHLLLNRSGGSRNKHPKAALRQGDVMTIALATVFILGTLTLLVAGYLTATAEY
jgi:hypothetical protein